MTEIKQYMTNDEQQNNKVSESITIIKLMEIIRSLYIVEDEQKHNPEGKEQQQQIFKKMYALNGVFDDKQLYEYNEVLERIKDNETVEQQQDNANICE